MNDLPSEAPEPVVARRERDRRIREEDFLAAAERLFGERGFQDASMEEIAREAGYATGTIYRYFESKQALFGELLHRRLAEYFGVVEAAVDGEAAPREKLRALIRAKVRFFVMNQAFLRLYIGATDAMAGMPGACPGPQSEVRQKFLGLQRKVLEEAAAAGLFSPERQGWVGAAIIGLTNNVLLAALTDASWVEEQELVDFFIRTMENGLWKAS